MAMMRRRAALAVCTSVLCLAAQGESSAPSAKPRPHIVFALADDLGWNYPGYHNPEVITPTLDKLAGEGVRLESHYTYKYCSPTRAAFLIGRYPYHLVNTRCNLIPSSIPEGTDLGYTMLPKQLAKAGYVSHAVGKWHQGFQTPEYTPVGRGFNTSYMFLQGGQDHWTHWCGASKALCGIDPTQPDRAGAWDLWVQSNENYPGEPVLGINGTTGDISTYSGFIFTKRVVDIIEAAGRGAGGQAAHVQPFFVYWALHNTHAPIEAPPRFVSLYSHFNDSKKETFSGMMTAVDEAVRNVTEALKSAQLWENTLFVWTTDNGSPVSAGGSNHPLKGGKGTNWEGGIRVPTFVCGGYLGPKNRGKLLDGLIHVMDWHAIFLNAASGDDSLSRHDAAAESLGLPAPESLDIWPYINGDVAASPRTELIIDHHMFTNASAQNGTCAGQEPFAVPGVPALGALRLGDWKLIVGPNQGATWYGRFSPNATDPFTPKNKCDCDNSTMNRCVDCAWDQCLPACLYNIRSDPGEHVDVAQHETLVLAKLLKRFKELEGTYHPRVVAPPILKAAFCKAAQDHSGFTAPFCHYTSEGEYCA